MLSGILLVLGRSKASLVARKVAFDLAHKRETSISGLVVVDPEIVAPPEATPIGAVSYKEHKDEVALAKARADAIEFERGFAKACQDAGIRCDASVIQGRTLASLIGACALNDLVVAGIDASFEADQAAALSPMIQRLLRDNPRPVVVCPAHVSQGKTTLVAYDGSVAAMRALQLFCLLGLRSDGDISVVTVRANEAEAADISRHATEYLRKHGYNADSHPIQSAGAPHDAITAHAKKLHAGMIVAGAYGHQGWREWFLGTTTQHLFKTSPAPVFVHH